MKSINVLLVEDNEDHADLIRQLAAHETSRIAISHCTSLAQTRNLIGSDRFDVVLLDLGLPDSRIEETLVNAKDYFDGLPVIILTAMNEASRGADAVRNGAQDYLVKSSLSPDLLYRSIVHSIERHRVERELQRYAAELERMNENLRRFSHAVAHEVRNPLTVVTSGLRLLSRHSSDRLDDQAREILHETELAVERLHGLIREMLTFSKVDGEVPQGGEPVALNDVVEEAKNNLKDFLAVHRATVTVGDLPLVHGSQRMLVHVFQNLLSNAVQYRDERPPVIAITGSSDGDTATIAVEDNGIGIDENELESIFSLFYRGARSHAEGSGIGLAFCRHMIEMHGGRMWAESSPGRGSTIYITFRMKPAADVRR